MRRPSHPRASPHPSTRRRTARHREQIAILRRLRGVGGQGTVGAVGVDELLKVGARRFTEFYETSSSVSTTDDRAYSRTTRDDRVAPLLIFQDAREAAQRLRQSLSP